VVVQGKNEHDIEIDIIDPLAVMQAVDGDEMKEITEEIHYKHEKALNSLSI
jgi:hypothetical protein